LCRELGQLRRIRRSVFGASIGVSTGFGAIAAGGASSGFVSGGLTLSIHGGSFLGGAWRGVAAGASAGVTGGFISGTGMTALGGGNFGESLGAGFRGALIGGVTGGVLGGLSSGLQAKAHGYNFWSGDPVVGPQSFAWNCCDNTAGWVVPNSGNEYGYHFAYGSYLGTGYAGSATVTGNPITTAVREGMAAAGRVIWDIGLTVGTSMAGGLVARGVVSTIRAARGASIAARGVSVIGPRATYREFAKKIGANFLNVTDDAWTMRKNVKFLQGVVKRGDDVIFSGKYNPAKLDPSSVLAQEIRYLQRHGYSWNKDFTRLIKQ